MEDENKKKESEIEKIQNELNSENENKKELVKNLTEL